MTVEEYQTIVTKDKALIKIEIMIAQKAAKSIISDLEDGTYFKNMKNQENMLNKANDILSELDTISSNFEEV